jgi:hypothetical protein
MNSGGNNSFFVCKRYYLYLFETIGAAEIAYPDKACLAIGIMGNIRHGSPNFSAKRLTEKLGSVVRYTMPSEPIFLIEKEKYSTRYGTDHCEFWHVIVGEHVGWLCVTDTSEIEPLT